MGRILGHVSLRARLFAVLLVPLVGMAVFASLWAVDRRSAARDSAHARRQIDLVVETIRALRTLDLLYSEARPVAAAGGPEVLGPITGLVAQKFKDVMDEERTSRAALLGMRGTATPRERSIIDSTVAAIDGVLAATRTDPTKPRFYTARNLDTFRDAASRVRRNVTSLTDDAGDLELVQGASVLVDLADLRAACMWEAVLTLRKASSHRPLSTLSVDRWSTQCRTMERFTLRRLTAGDRVLLGDWRERAAWNAFQAEAVAGRHPAILTAIMTVLNRQSALGSLQDRIAARLQDQAAKAESQASGAFRLAVAVAMSLTVLSLLLGAGMVRTITRGLRRLARQAEAIGAGDLRVEPLPVQGRDETAVLAVAFNQMSATLAILQEQVDTLADGEPASGAIELPGRIGEAVARSVARLAGITGALRTSEEVARLTVANAVEAIWTLDEDGRVVSLNPTAQQLDGRQAGDITGGRLDDHLVWQGLELPGDGMPVPVTELECRVGPPGAEPQDVLVTVRHVSGAAGDRTMVFARDITERKRLEDRLEWDALHDPLTGLPNRTGLRRELLETAEEHSGRPLALMFLDLDRFKQVNDALGHRHGDELLRQVARRLVASVRVEDLVARLGGDEFVIACRVDEDGPEVDQFATRVIETLEQPYRLGGGNGYVSASIGVVVTEDAVDPEELIRQADLAMYRAKHTGRGRVCRYHAEMQDEVRERVAVEARLHGAIAGGEFTAYYQPIVSLSDGSVDHFELLARWFPPDGEPISPGVFIPVAEESGLVIEIGRWALTEAALMAAQLDRRRPGAGVGVAVNISGLHVMQADLVADVRAALAGAGVRPELLHIEITESYMLGEANAHVDAVLAELVAMGVGLSVDDFGTGYSSLTYLRRIPANVVKIDRSYVAAMDTDPNEISIIRMVTTMASGLGMTVVAEGLETERQRVMLIEAGCTHAQGFLIARPMPEGQLWEWMGALQGGLRVPLSWASDRT
ncbi:MAG: EAL domain-containing protein [Thermoleophilia bacterium]